MRSEVRVRVVVLMLSGVISFGTVGYCVIEDWTVVDSFYMTLITISTIGYGEVHPLSYYGRIFTSFLIIIGVGTVGYALGSLTQSFVEGNIQKILGKRKMEKDIQKLSDHYIICGYGRVGRQVAKEFRLRNFEVVVVENRMDMVELATRDKVLVCQEDATVEEALIAAGIKRAKGLVAAIGSDANNVFITLSAKGLNPNIFVVVRAEAHSSEKKLLRAGADRVISPYLIGGRKMALAAMRPNIVEFMDIVTPDEDTGFRIEEIFIQPHSQIVGIMLKDSDIRQNFGVIVIGVKTNDGKLVFNPPPDYRMQEQDILIAVGSPEQLTALSIIADSPQ